MHGVLSLMSTIRTNYERLSLTTKSQGHERVPSVSGLNWGQRVGRNENQAYLAVPVSVQQTGFFPPIGDHFMMNCDDGTSFVCVRAQQNGKAIHTPYDNSLLGKYFRSRLGVEFGDPVLMVHLINYGRTSVDVFKDGENKYYLDFAQS